MSYILEALKKIDQRREQKEQTKSLMFLGASVPETRKNPRWVYPVIAVLLLNAGIMVWWIGPWRSDKKDIPAKPPIVLQPGPMVSKAADDKEPRSAETLKEVRPSGSLTGFQEPVAGKEERNGSFPVTGKARNADRVLEKPAAYQKGAPEYDSNEIPSAGTKTTSKTRLGPVEKKVIYFKDGTKESCDEVRLTDNFIHCTKMGGGSITNLNKIDLEKTFSEKTP